MNPATGVEGSSEGAGISAESYEVHSHVALSANQTTANLTNGSPRSTPWGNNYAQTGSAGGAGRGIGQVTDSSLYGQFFIGPYAIGQSLRNGNFAQMGMDTMLGAAVNIVVTGWMINIATERASPLDIFGLTASAVAQIGYGLFLSPMGSVRTKDVNQ